MNCNIHHFTNVMGVQFMVKISKCTKNALAPFQANFICLFLRFLMQNVQLLSFTLLFMNQPQNVGWQVLHFY